MESLYPVLAGVIGAIASWNISRLQERQKSKSLDLEYVRSLIDEQIKDLRDERDRSHDEMVKLRERTAVLEAQIREMERSRIAAVSRLQQENAVLKRQVDRLTVENEQLRLRLAP
ncbi:MAG: hypothetical protein F6K28_27800 [Microcoleus sp. SIO2G3]|nr:hypothetical protein [Microcoleus sp. SIO2G3]